MSEELTNKGFTVFLECSGPFQIRPGLFTAPMGDGRFIRVWWLWFAIGISPLPLDVWHQRIQQGRILWET